MTEVLNALLHPTATDARTHFLYRIFGAMRIRMEPSLPATDENAGVIPRRSRRHSASDCSWAA